MQDTILFVEDEPDLGNLIKQYLEVKGFSVHWYNNASAALDAFRAKQEEYALCLLDVQMPGKSGFALAENIIHLNRSIPFVFLTARTEKQDRMQGLKIGAADYINKPFDIDELALKLTNIIRMCSAVPRTEEAELSYAIGDLLFNTERLTITCVTGEVIKLTIREAELIEFFYKNRNRRIKKEEILKSLWGENDYFSGRSLDVFISRLRKLLSHSETVKLSNVYGAGYIFSV